MADGLMAWDLVDRLTKDDIQVILIKSINARMTTDGEKGACCQRRKLHSAEAGREASEKGVEVELSFFCISADPGWGGGGDCGLTPILEVRHCFGCRTNVSGVWNFSILIFEN